MPQRPVRVTARVAPRPDGRRWILIAAAIATAAAALASSVGAQTAPSEQVAVALSGLAERQAEPAAPLAAPERAEVRSTVGPRVHEGLIAYKPAVSSQLEAVSLNERERMRPASRNNAALIVVGLSAIVLGSVIDDDAGSILILGGAGVTLYGLWQYLK